MGEFPAATDQDPLNYHGGTGDYWEGVQAAIDQNDAEVLALQQRTVAQNAGALMLANA